ncbi:MAG TPA: copper resistance CopC family protein, partial [Acidimicrobiales bacterium]|nr:copper resistance CopC family protein [Acidimicrobiales bacterium]
MQRALRPRARAGVAAGLVGAALAAVLLLGARPAGAHAFLVGATPAPGARLTAGPARISLRFSEALSSHGSGIDLEEAGGPTRRLVLSLTGGGTAMEASPSARRGALGSGVYTVTWRAVSAVDGHLTSGSFSFGVGRFSGVVPAPTSGTPFPNPLQAAASWLVVGGTAAALGGLTAAGRGARSSPLVVPGLGVGLAGAALQTVAVLATAGTSPPRLAYLALATAAALGAALAVLPWTERRELPVGLTVAALVVWVGAGHGPAQAGRWGWATEAAHVVAVSAWLGAVLQAVVAGLRSRDTSAGRRRALAAQARPAALALAGVAGTGVALAFEVLPGPGALLSSAYGRVIVAKAALLLGAVGLALARRFRAEAVTVVAAVAAGAVLAQIGPPAPGLPAAAVLGPPPLAGPVLRSGGLAGALTVGLAVGA